MDINHAALQYKFEYSKLIKEAKDNEPKPKEQQVRKIPSCERRLWQKYRRRVWKITEKQNLKKLPDYEKRAFRGYHLDHKVSIWYGYKHKLEPKMIGSIDNLEFIPYKDNMKKGIRCNWKNAKDFQTILFV